MSDSVRVLIADDHLIVREGLRLILEAADGIKLVGEATDGAEAVRLASI
jgi:DNA-binding NarL/FixJ family response regulator